jgi:hypothetical protein
MLVSNKEMILDQKSDEDDEQNTGIRKGRAIALRKLKAAKQKAQANKNHPNNRNILILII